MNPRAGLSGAAGQALLAAMMMNRTAFSVLAALLLPVRMLTAAPVSVTELKDLKPEAPFYQDVQSLVERWGIVSDGELAVAAKDAGQAPGGSLYFPDAKLTNRQMAIILFGAMETLTSLLDSAQISGGDVIRAARRSDKITQRTAELLQIGHSGALTGLINLSFPTWRQRDPYKMPGLDPNAEEFEPMCRLLEKYQTGAAFVGADGTFTGPRVLDEKFVIAVLNHVFRHEAKREGGQQRLGKLTVDPVARTVSRGRFASILQFYLNDFESRLTAQAAKLEDQIKATATPAPAPAPAPTPAPAAAPPGPAPAKKLNTQQIINAMNAKPVRYEPSSPALAAASTAILAEIAAHIKMLPLTTRVEISVHTDSNGDAAANLQLTQSRANNVRTALIGLGVPATMLTAKGYGSTKPVAGNATDDDRKKNRRTEFNLRAP